MNFYDDNSDESIYEDDMSMDEDEELDEFDDDSDEDDAPDDDESDDSFVVHDSSSVEEYEADGDDEWVDGMDPSNIVSSRLRDAAVLRTPARYYWDGEGNQSDSLFWADADRKDVFAPLDSDDDIRSGDEDFSDEED
jgi:hypothetical protein